MDFFLSCGSKSAPDSSMIYYFCLAQKGTRKHTQYFKLLFFQVNPHFCTWNQISTSRKTKFTSCNLTCHGLFFPRNAGDNHTDQSILLAFYSVWQESTHKPSKIEYAKKKRFLHCVRYRHNLLWWMKMNEWNLFHMKSYNHFTYTRFLWATRFFNLASLLCNFYINWASNLT